MVINYCTKYWTVCSIAPKVFISELIQFVSRPTSGVSRNLIMCIHILETMNSIAYLAQSYCVGCDLRLGIGSGIILQWRKISIFYKYNNFRIISIIILGNF